MQMSDGMPASAGGCSCRGGSTHGTGDPAVRRCDICGGAVAADAGTGEFVAAVAVPGHLRADRAGSVRPHFSAGGDSRPARAGKGGLHEPGDADLAALGWAPGDYMMRCHDCGAAESFGAKRRLRCRACAAALWMAAQAGGERAVAVATPCRREVIASALCDAMNAPGAWQVLGADARTVWLHRGDGLVRALAAREWLCEPIAGIESLESGNNDAIRADAFRAGAEAEREAGACIAEFWGAPDVAQRIRAGERVPR